MGKLIVGCGYLGVRVAQCWLDRGEEVWGTTRSAERAQLLADLGIKPICCDVLQPQTLRDLPSVSTILYCVGFDRSAGPSMRQIYVEGLTNVLKHLQGWPPHRFIHISSTSVYSQTDGDWVDESAPTAPLSDSGRVVLEAEQALRSHAPAAIILRLAGIYGTGRLFRSDSLVNGKPLPGDPSQWLNLIHVEDAATAVLAADERAEASALYNVADGEPVLRGDFFRFLAELLGAPPPRFGGSEVNDRTNRRISNARMLKGLGVPLKYPSYRQGLAASLGMQGTTQISS